MILGSDDLHAGLGALVGPRHVLTCAHVVNAALGVDASERSMPSGDIRVGFPFLNIAGAVVSTATVEMWRPPVPSSNGDGVVVNDLAGLLLHGDPPAQAVPGLVAADPPRQGTAVRVFGYPDGPPHGVWASAVVQAHLPDGEQLGPVPGSPGIAMGFSGSPVFDDAIERIVGLADRFVGPANNPSHAIGVRQLREAWPEVLNEEQALEQITREPGAVTLNPALTALRSAVVSPTGILAATYGSSPQAGHSLSVWNLQTGAPQKQVTLDSRPVAARFTEDESALIAVTRDDQGAQVLRLSLNTRSDGLELLYETTGIRGIALSRDSRTAVLRGINGFLVLDTESGRKISTETGRRFDKVAVAPHGELIAALTASRIEIYRQDSLPESSSSPPGISENPIGQLDVGTVISMDCSAGNVVVASANSVSVVWSEAGSERTEIYFAPENIRRIAVGSTGSMVAVAHGSKFTIVDLITRDLIMERDAVSPVNRLTFRLDDKVLVTAHEDNAARLWELPNPLAGSRDNLDWQSDAPARKDLLHRKPLASALAARLRRFQDEERTSFLVHIDGPWGSRKSTLLRLLQEELERGILTQPDGLHQSEWLTIDFNAWQQSKVGASWWALLAALRRDVTRGRRPPARYWLRAAETWTRFRRAGAPFVLAFLVLIALAVGLFFLVRPSKLTFESAADIARGASALMAALGIIWAGSKVAARFLLWDSAQGARLYEQSSINPMLDVSRHFGWLVAKSGKPVVFFIDDLDRCTDAYVVELLETVQTLVRDPPGRGGGAVARPPSFVVAADGAWIRRAFETSYSQFGTAVAEPRVPLGYLFLDKLFQVRVRVPRLEEARRDQYLRYLLGTTPENVTSAAIQASLNQVRSRVARSSGEAGVLQAYGNASSEVRDLVAPDVVDKLSSLPVAAATEHWLQQFAPLLPPNPRAMKRFINDYSILRAVRTLEGNAVGMEPLALWVIIGIRWPGLADYLCMRPEAIELVRQPEAGSTHLPTVDDVPSNLARLFADPDLRRLVSFKSGRPLTAELITQCCGMGPFTGES